MARLKLLFLFLLLPASLALAVNDDRPADPSVRPYSYHESQSGLTLRFDPLNLSWQPGDDGGEVPILPGAGETGVAGGPRLPVYSELIAVPEGMNLVLRRVNAHWRNLGVHDLAAEPDQDNQVLPDEASYKKIARESGETVVVGTTGRWRDLRVAAVAIRPMKLDESTGDVLIADDLSVVFGFEPSLESSAEFDPPGISEALLPLYEDYVINARTYINYNEIERGTYLMIYPPNWVSDVQTLADWRTKTGFNTVIVSTDVTGTSFNSIHDYLDDFYATSDPPLDYVCLMGDMDDYPNIATTYIDPGVPFPYDPQIATDQKYTYDLAGGDTYEAVLPRFLIGRISVDSQTELRTVVNKILQYEAAPFAGNPDRWLRAVTIADASGSVSTALTQDWVKYKMVNNGFTNVTQLVRWGFGQDPGAQGVANAINNYVSWVTYRGYGSHTYWAGPYFYNSDIDTRIFNTNNVPVITSMVCGGGAFDELGAEDPCFGEKWIRHGSPIDLKGAVAFVAPSEIDTHTRWNNMILGGWYVALFDQGLRTLGQCLLSAKIQLYNNYPTMWNAGGSNQNSVWFYFHSYNILGDPALQLRAETPKILNVDHPDDLRENDSHAEIIVLDEFGIPIENAMVVVTHNGTEIAGKARSRANGVADVILDQPPDNGEYELTVTRPDVEPFQYIFGGGAAGIVDLAATNGVEDPDDPATNDDGVINPGELISPVSSFLVNHAGGLSDVLVSISVHTEDATIESSYQYFDAQGEGNTFQTSDLRIRVRTNVPDGTRIPVTYQIYSNNGSISHTAELPPVRRPTLLEDGITFEGDWYPGDRTNVDVQLDNLSDLVGAASVNGSLTMDDPFVTVPDSYGQWPAIAAGTNGVHMSNLFQLEVSEDAYPGHKAIGNLTLTTDRGFLQVLQVQFEVMGAGPTAPSGPAGPGYYIFDNIDAGYDYTPNFTYSSIVGNGGVSVGLTDHGNNQDDVNTVNLPFSFPYWDQVYSQISVCSNGWLSFGQSGFYFFRNRPLPGALTPVAGIMPYWDDLVLDYSNSGVYTYNDVAHGWFVVEWYRVFHYNDTGRQHRIDFQVLIMNPAVHGTVGGLGKIAVLYQNVYNNDVQENYLTMGITNPDGTQGLQYEFANMPDETAGGVANGRQLMIVAAGANWLSNAHVSFRPPLVQLNSQTGGTGGGELTITNDGGRATTYDIWPEGISFDWGLPGENDEFGEPDDLGYRWYDSREYFGPEYQWVDIEQPGNTVSLNDGDPDGFGSISGEINLPWAFPYYGANYHSLWISESGYITFELPAVAYGSSSNTALPRPYAPTSAVFPYWDNVGTDEGGAVYAHGSNQVFVVTWADVRQLSWDDNDGPYTFQVVLSPDGAIHTQYFAMDGQTDSATIGLNNEDGSEGLLTAYNTGVPGFLIDELTVRFSPGLPWLTVSPGSHSIGPGETITVQLSANANGVPAGLYNGRLLLLSRISGESYALPVDYLVTDDDLGYSPLIGEIPGESIEPEGTFAPIYLDPYVEDWDHGDADLNWNVFGSDSLHASIDDNHVATITADPGWVGPATLYFRANDPLFNNQTVQADFDTQGGNDSPRFDTASPDALGLVGSGSTILFSATAFDPEQDEVDYEWYHDGAFLGVAESAEVTFDQLGSSNVQVIARDSFGATSEIVWTANVFDTGVAPDDAAQLPRSFALENVYPNPFNANVVLRYALPNTADVRLVVYNLLGQEVTRQQLASIPAGHHELVLDASHWASGLYFVDWRAGGVRQVRKAVLLK